MATPFDLEGRPWQRVSGSPWDGSRQPAIGAPGDGGDDVVDIWRLRHDLVGAAADVADLLSPAERSRAERYRRADDRRRFVVGRAGLRIVLARRGDTRPHTVQLQQRCRRCGGAHGRITVDGPGRLAGTHVSVSHTPAWTVYAVADSQHVGVDIEADDAAVEDAATVFTTSAERAAVRDLPATARHVALVELWTRKEAVLKARGTGMLDAPDGIDVLGRGSAVHGAPPGRHLHRLVVDSAHHGTLAVNGAACTVELWTFVPGE